MFQLQQNTLCGTHLRHCQFPKLDGILLGLARAFTAGDVLAGSDCFFQKLKKKGII